MLPISQYLFLSFALLSIGLVGVITRRNLMAFARLYGDVSGQIFAMLTVAVLAIELLVALAIIAAFCTRWNCAVLDDQKDLSSQLDY